MNRIQHVFGVPRVLLPVIHPISEIAALRSIDVASEAGCPGVFLINQGMASGDVLAFLVQARARWPHLWLGVNLLGHSPQGALRRALRDAEGRLDGLWSDQAGIDEYAKVQREAGLFVEVREQLGWQGLYFGGVAFKGQPPVADEDLCSVATLAEVLMDVVCTSGPGTGVAAPPSKVQAMRGCLSPEGCLALASGVTEENVGDYLPFVDAFLVGTGIERSLGVLDAGKVARLQTRVATYRPATPAPALPDAKKPAP